MEYAVDAEFERRWQNTYPPFDGVTLTLKNYVPLSVFQPVIAAVVERLYLYRPDASLYRLLDWHEHDGFVTVAGICGWKFLRSLVASEANLISTFHLGDTDVREGFFPAERDYYLRLYVPDIYDNPYHRHDDPDLIEYGMFDVTCPLWLATEIDQVVRMAGISETEILSAKTFFDDSYGG